MEPLANLNGRILPLAEVRISPLDRGFLFGDAVYEVLRVYAGKPWLLDEHLARLARSLEAIRISGVDPNVIRSRILETIAAGPFTEAIVYVQITRGAAPRKHTFPTGATPLEFLYVQEFHDPYVEARRTGAAVITHAELRWKRCDIKSTNLLGNVLAAQAAHEAGAVEAVFHNPDGTLTEGTHTSLFGVLNGKLLTAPTTPAILPGITRRLILKLAREEGVPVEERLLKLADLPQIAELFLTGTTSEVLPVVRVDNHQISDGRPGPITRRLQAAYTRAAGSGTVQHPGCSEQPGY